jgi:hypothetical protein
VRVNAAYTTATGGSIMIIEDRVAKFYSHTALGLIPYKVQFNAHIHEYDRVIITGAYPFDHPGIWTTLVEINEQAAQAILLGHNLPVQNWFLNKGFVLYGWERYQDTFLAIHQCDDRWSIIRTTRALYEKTYGVDPTILNL